MSQDRALLLSISDFAQLLRESLLARPGYPPSFSSLELHHYIEVLSENHVLAAEKYKYFDEQGTELWNVSWKLRKENQISVQIICLSMIALSLASYYAADWLSPGVCLLASGLRPKGCRRLNPQYAFRLFLNARVADTRIR